MLGSIAAIPICYKFVFITFCPGTRLLDDKIVKPSPGPSSDVEFEAPSFSLSFCLLCLGGEKKQELCKETNQHLPYSVMDRFNQLLQTSSSQINTLLIVFHSTKIT